MSALDNIGNFSTGVLPFTFGESKIDAMTNQEIAVVRGAKTLGAAVMTLNGLWDVVNISNTITNVMLSTDTTFNFSNLSKDVISLAVSALWAYSNIGWIKRSSTVRN